MISHCPFCQSQMVHESNNHGNKQYHQIICAKCGTNPGFESYVFCAFYDTDQQNLLRTVVTLNDIKLISTFDATIFNSLYQDKEGTSYLRHDWEVPHHDRPIVFVSTPFPISTKEEIDKAINFLKTAAVFQ